MLFVTSINNVLIRATSTLFPHLMEVETERLKLRLPKSKDHSFILELVNSPGWLRFIGERNIQDQDAALNYINSLISDYRAHGFGLMVVELKEEHTPIGLCGLLQRDYLDAPDLGFAMLPQYQRMGYTFEAAKSVLQHSEADVRPSHFLAITNKDNLGSQRLLTKLGFVEKQLIKDPKSSKPNLLYSRKTINDHETETIDNIL